MPRNQGIAIDDNWKKLPKSEKLSRLIDSELQVLRSELEGRLLTFLEAVVSDKEQREAIKSTFRNLYHETFYKSYWEIISYLDGHQKALGENKPEWNTPVGQGWRDTEFQFK